MNRSHTVTEDMSHLPPALERALDVLVGIVLLGLAAIGIGYEATTVLPAVFQEHVSAPEKVSDIVGIGGMAVMAPYGYLLEWADRHNRLRAQFWRKISWGFQIILVSLCIADELLRHKPMEIPVGLSAVVTGALAWAVWMRTQLLPPEEQAVIDKLIVEQEVQQTRAVREAQQRRREQRFQRAVTRYQGSAEAAIPAPRRPAEPEPFPWPIPEGKHRPYVYFVRNGDRVKIGTSTNVRNRISSLSLRTSDIVLLLLGDRHGEQGLHRKFADLRIGNTEWFHYTGAVTEYVAAETDKVRAADKTKG
jgi:hypothetical protein